MAEIEVNGARTYVEERGSGRPVVLVHGLGASTELWRHVAGSLAEEFRVVAYDLRNAGRSEITGDTNFEQLVHDLDGVVDALDLGQTFVVGHSMSGAVVLAYAVLRPSKVLGVVGVGAPAELPDAAREGMRARADTVEAEGMAAVAETVATNGTAPSFREGRPDEFRAFVAMLEANDPRGYASLCRVVATIDITADLSRIAAPVLLVAGDRDGVSPPAANEANAARIPDARYVQVEDCGHILPLEKPQALLGSALPFLRDAVA